MSIPLTSSNKPNKPHFVALDSWRGIAACAVALHHFYANTPIFDAGIIRNAGAFVDFFFVLSGFVIAYNYQDKLRTGFSLKKFMTLRLGRLYPLHITVLILMIAFEAIFANIISQYSSTARAPFSGPASDATQHSEVCNGFEARIVRGIRGGADAEDRRAGRCGGGAACGFGWRGLGHAGLQAVVSIIARQPVSSRSRVQIAASRSRRAASMLSAGSNPSPCKRPILPRSPLPSR